MSEKIWLSSPHMSKEGYEKEYIEEAFDTNWIAPLGTNVNEFEKELADMVNMRRAAAVISGTAAIHLAMKLANVKEGDIVFTQTFTFAATVNPIIYEKATPVFIDSEEETWNMDPYMLEKAFKKYPEVKAVIVVHLYGMSAKIKEIKEICDRHNVTLIEDAAESLGSKYNGQPSGTHGDYGIYSFNGNKIITTSGGGMLVSNNKEAIKKAKFWSTQSRDSAPYYQHSEIGYNYRMSNVLAGIGRGQLKVLNKRVAKKRYIYEFYKNELKNIKDIHFLQENENNYSNRWLSTIILSGDIKPSQVLEALNKNNIEGRHLWKPMHLQPVFKDYDYIGSDISEELFNTGLCLPSDTKMTDGDLKRVCDVIKEIWTEH